MWGFIDETRGVIGNQHRRLGASVDWSRERFTMDEMSARAVRTAISRMVMQGWLEPVQLSGGRGYRATALATRRLDDLVATGWPVLVALSNKDFVGETLDLPVDQRLTGTLAATAVSAWLGARVFRVHDVAATRQTLDMVASIRGDRPPARTTRGLA